MNIKTASQLAQKAYDFDKQGMFREAEAITEFLAKSAQLEAANAGLASNPISLQIMSHGLNSLRTANLSKNVNAVLDNLQHTLASESKVLASASPWEQLVKIAQNKQEQTGFDQSLEQWLSITGAPTDNLAQIKQDIATYLDSKRNNEGQIDLTSNTDDKAFEKYDPSTKSAIKEFIDTDLALANTAQVNSWVHSAQMPEVMSPIMPKTDVVAEPAKNAVTDQLSQTFKNPREFKDFTTKVQTAVKDWEAANGRPIDRRGWMDLQKVKGPIISQYDRNKHSVVKNALQKLVHHLEDDETQQDAQAYLNTPPAAKTAKPTKKPAPAPVSAVVPDQNITTSPAEDPTVVNDLTNEAIQTEEQNTAPVSAPTANPLTTMGIGNMAVGDDNDALVPGGETHTTPEELQRLMEEMGLDEMGDVAEKATPDPTVDTAPVAETAPPEPTLAEPAPAPVADATPVVDPATIAPAEDLAPPVEVEPVPAPAEPAAAPENVNPILDTAAPETMENDVAPPDTNNLAQDPNYTPTQPNAAIPTPAPAAPAPAAPAPAASGFTIPPLQPIEKPAPERSWLGQQVDKAKDFVGRSSLPSLVGNQAAGNNQQAQNILNTLGTVLDEVQGLRPQVRYVVMPLLNHLIEVIKKDLGNTTNIDWNAAFSSYLDFGRKNGYDAMINAATKPHPMTGSTPPAGFVDQLKKYWQYDNGAAGRGLNSGA